MTLVTEKAHSLVLELVAGNVSALLAEAVAMVVDGVNTSDSLNSDTIFTFY